MTPRSVAGKKRPGYYLDGHGLYLQVSTFGTKSWVFRFARSGKARDMGLGAVHTYSLKEARARAMECRQQLDQGIDPIEARKARRAADLAAARKTLTFSDCAKAYIQSHRAAWKNTKHVSQWENTLATYVYPEFGKLPVQEVDRALVMRALEPIWTTIPETATRVRGRIEVVLDWATARGYRIGENPARWRGHLDKLLPKREKVRAVRHHAALPYAQLPAFMVELKKQEGVSARALEFLILTAARTSEVIGSKWDEFDAEEKLWTIPASRMKSGKEHRVPLSPAAVDLISAMAATRVNDYVFPGLRKNSPLSNMALLVLLRRMGRSDLTAHGFRSSFRDWAAERTHCPREVAEAALAHTLSDKTEAAYRRGDLFEKRRELMTEWARYCNTPARSGKIVSINRG